MTTAAPLWAHCGQGAAASDPFAGCAGRTVTVSGRCLAHADDAEQAAYLAFLTPGADLDLRGTTVDDLLLGRILSRVTDSATHRPTVGTARFTSATFTGDARFDQAIFTRDVVFDRTTFNRETRFGSATFNGTARFDQTTFNGHARFDQATFNGYAWFGSATFDGTAGFDQATFNRDTWFGSATFNGAARFDSATFNGAARFNSATFNEAACFDQATFNEAAQFDQTTFNMTARFDQTTFNRDTRFNSATFNGYAWFGSATFDGTAGFNSATFNREVVFERAIFNADAQFTSAVFEGTSRLGPLVCAKKVVLPGASFRAAVTVEIAAREVELRRTRWTLPATVWVRYADVDLSDAVTEYPLTVAARLRPFTNKSGEGRGEYVLAGVPTDVRVTSLRGVDAAQLVLTDLDVSQCLFAGAVHLDQLRLEGDCRFAEPPQGVHRRSRALPVRYTRRSTLAEEHHWRRSLPGAVPGWQAPPTGVDLVQPRALAAVYRALRKSHEDSSNEPGAADFYYGEMEMRRADHRTPRAERGLIAAYWALSGYGLRATRALLWLLLAITLTMLTMMLWGLPQHDTPSLSTGALTGHRITMTTDNPDPQNPTGPPGDRLTSARFEKSLRVVVNSVIFRSSGQDLTTAGTYTEMASRLIEPVLLGLAALAVRGRIKR